MSRYQFIGRSIDDAIPMVEKLLRNFENVESNDQERFVSVLISRPGVGKSATVSKMAKRMGYSFVDLNLACIEPSDIIGLGAREKVNGRWQTIPALPSWTEKAFAGECIIFVDEFNNTTMDVLAGFQKMFSDFTIDGRELPRTTHIVGACNPPGQDALFASKRLSGAFRRRLCMIPIVDDFSYVQQKYGFVFPKAMYNPSYEDIIEYCSYDEFSSAVVDNVFSLYNMTNLTDLEKAVLMNGFGQGALDFAKQMGLVSSNVIASSSLKMDGVLTEQEWLSNPVDQITEYQQILWGQSRIQRSVSYSRSKKFVSRVENVNVYSVLYDVLKERFSDDYELDDMKLPTRTLRETSH